MATGTAAKKKSARHVSAVKRARQNERRRVRNRTALSRMRTTRKAAKQAAGDTQAQAFVAFQKAVDRAAKQGIIHKRTASRMKSRLAKKPAAK